MASLSPQFKENVENSGIGLFYPDQSQTHIECLFVYPELQILDELSRKDSDIIRGSSLLSSLKKKARWIIFGDY